MTIAEIVRDTTNTLRPHSDAPQLDAERITLSALGQRESTYLITHSKDPVSTQQAEEIARMQNLRITGMPLAYILGEADFYGRTFLVTPDVLIPRPDTEALIERAREIIPKLSASLHRPLAIADVCTGSGCIAITMALEFPEHTFIATDISPAALAIAKQNAKKHGAEDRITFLQGDMLEPLQDKQVDLILSNPPYIPTEEVSQAADTIETRGLLFEPHIALDGGVDGQTFVDAIKESNIPAIVETTGGTIRIINFIL